MSSSEEKRPSSAKEADKALSNDGSATRSESSARGSCPADADAESSSQRIVTRLDGAKLGPASDDRSPSNSGKKPFKRAATSVQRQVAVTNVFQDESGARRKGADGGRRQLSDGKLENTYKMEPDAGFSVSQSEKVILQVFSEQLVDVSYAQETCSDLAKTLSQTIMARLKEMDSFRHKYVCHVIVGEKTYQSVQVASRCLWNVQTDNSAMARFDNKSIFAVGLVYGIYFE